MYAGRIVEEAPVGDLFRAPAHPYTAGLLRSMPRPGVTGRRLVGIEGNVPDLARLPTGCAFHPRCADRLPECPTFTPALLPLPATPRRVACLLHHDTNGQPRGAAQRWPAPPPGGGAR
jgi:oligopeptide/dipeptide ABC transporter ATP-binding protein